MVLATRQEVDMHVCYSSVKHKKGYIKNMKVAAFVISVKY